MADAHRSFDITAPGARAAREPRDLVRQRLGGYALLLAAASFVTAIGHTRRRGPARVAGFSVIALVVAPMILLTPRGQIPVHTDGDDPQSSKPAPHPTSPLRGAVRS